ncbi:DNA polymerase [Rhodobacter sp. JA431]|uniref:TIGR03915 family putative DNA repair protein n=1 Tax=Rhodobacter sp. JA431 TaxID=570013 RepID=UPI000BC7D588|nr:TIGR03915 family putative DNA repair protein [Rhodobacter sp. JA431]SOB92205.1 DNA polymerase [Rhodobacter sp. JA431]
MQVVLPRIGTVAAWRKEARRLAAAGVAPEAVIWSVGTAAPDLFAAALPTAAGAVALTLPRVAVEGLETALMHSDPERFARAYALVLRLSRRELRWGDRSDPMMRRVLDQEKAVRRDIHKMHAFVRFREVTPPGANRRAFAAWFEPDHHILEAGAPFFARRFGDMDWLIATPTLTARFECGEMQISETCDTRPPPADATEHLWRVYFANIFNPARLMVQAMQSNMPRKYWKNLPEADLIPELIRSAPARVAAMREAEAQAPDPRLQKRLSAIAAQRIKD